MFCEMIAVLIKVPTDYDNVVEEMKTHIDLLPGCLKGKTQKWQGIMAMAKKIGLDYKMVLTYK